MRIVLDNIIGKSMLSAAADIIASGIKLSLNDLKPGDAFIVGSDIVDVFTNVYMVTPTVDTYDGSKMCVNLNSGNLIYFDCYKPILKAHVNVSLTNIPEVSND